MDKRKILTIVLVLFIFISTAGLSYFFFSQKSVTSEKVATSPLPGTQTAAGRIAFDASLPKTEACPLNGALYSKDQKNWWEKHRPLGVMIENHEDSRPQSGLSFADVVYEAVAEGSITRFLAVFYCQDAGIVGPIRSARTYFVDWISEYGESPLYSHVGGANQPGPADALGQIESYDWKLYNDLSQFSLSFPTYYRDETRLGRDVATEHTMYSKTSELWKVGAQRGLTNVDKNGVSWDKNFVTYSFKDDLAVSERPASQSLHLEPWKDYRQYAIDWKYDPVKNIYLRDNGGKPHIDKDTNQQITTKNIVVLSMAETNANDGYDNNVHLLYKDKGTGKAQIFIDGKKILGTWRKDKRTSRTLIFDSEGSPVKFDRGTIWFEILPLNGVLQVK